MNILAFVTAITLFAAPVQQGDPVLVPFDTSDSSGNCASHTDIADGDPLSGGNCANVELCFNETQQIDRVRFLAASSSATTTITVYEVGEPVRERVFLPSGPGEPQVWRDFPYPGEFDCLLFRTGPTGHPGDAPATLYEIEAYSNWHDPLPISIRMDTVLDFVRVEFISPGIITSFLYATFGLAIGAAILRAIWNGLLGGSFNAADMRAGRAKSLRQSRERYSKFWDRD